MPLLKTLLIYKICFWYPCWKSGNSIYFLEFISGSSLIFHWSTRLFRCSTMPSVSLWFWSTIWGQLFWFLHHFSPWLGFILAIESVLYFHMNFQIAPPPGFMNMLLKSTSDMCGRTEGEFEVEQNHGTQSYVSCTRMPWLAFYGTFIWIAQSTEFKAETEKHRISYHYHQMCSGDRKSHGPMGTVCITSLNVVNCISKERRGNSLYGAWERHSFLLGSKQSSIGTEFTQQDTVEKAITFTLQMSLEFW